VHCDERAVRRWVKRYSQTSTVKDEHRSGRHHKIDENTNINIIHRATEQCHIVPKQLKHELDLRVSTRTIRRRLDQSELYGRIARHSFPYSEIQLMKRLSFGNGYRSWGINQWGSVMYADETIIELSPHGQVWVQRPIGAAFDHQYISHDRVAHSVHVCIWGCFSRQGIGDIHIFSDDLDAVLMRSILRHHLVQSSQRLFPVNTSWWMLQDNDPKHSSRLVQEWLFSHGIQLIDFPPYSPDLNPVENLWANLKRRVEQHNPCSIEELTYHINHEWSCTDVRYLANLSDSMIKRCTDVVANQGHRTKY
jgi:hypothetical protein